VLPRRDLFLLPLIMVATLLALSVPAELVSRALYPSVKVDSCSAADRTSFHAKPNCISHVKIPEGPWATYRYNDCGFRTPEPCGPKPAGSLRVAVIGSSTSAGFMTPYEETMAARAAGALTERCRRPVEFQNLSAMGNHGLKLLESAKAAMSLNPDAMVMLVSPIDFDLSGDVHDQLVQKPTRSNPVRRIKDAIESSRLLYMESYFLLKDDDTYVPLFLRSGHNPDFMRAPLTPAWSRKLRNFEALMKQVAGLAKARGVPAVLIFAPQRAEASLASTDRFGHDYDPELLPNALGRIARNHGMIFADVTRAVPRNTPSDTLFYAMNGHLNGRGHALVADVLVHRLISPDVAAFGKVCTA
jgi:hypothetical protein